MSVGVGKQRVPGKDKDQQIQVIMFEIFLFL